MDSTEIARVQEARSVQRCVLSLRQQQMHIDPPSHDTAQCKVYTSSVCRKPACDFVGAEVAGWMQRYVRHIALRAYLFTACGARVRCLCAGMGAAMA